MKKVLKAVLILMAILTAIYVSAVVYANVNADSHSHEYVNSHRYVVYAAFECDTPPTRWYTTEELGIVEVWDIGKEGGAVQIVVDREKEPFPFGACGPSDQLTRFLHKDRFYTVASDWITFASSSGVKWQIPVGAALGAGWVCTGAVFLKWRNKE